LAGKKKKTSATEASNVIRDTPFGRQHPQCPDCGSRNSVPIVYGYPNEETLNASHRGEIVLGGTIVRGMKPESQCKDCMHRF